MPKITGTGTNANGNDYTSYEDGSYHYNNANGKQNILNALKNNINLPFICN